MLQRRVEIHSRHERTTSATQSSSGNAKERRHRPDYMTKEVFKSWICSFQESIAAQDITRRIILLVDNAPCHKLTEEDKQMFPNINLVFLPKNSTSVTQPLDAGIISVFKRFYQKEAAEATLVHHCSDKRTSITNLEGWNIIASAWSQVKTSSIRNCFGHVPIFGDEQKYLLSGNISHDSDILDAILYEEQIIDAFAENETIQSESAGLDSLGFSRDVSRQQTIRSDHQVSSSSDSVVVQMPFMQHGQVEVVRNNVTPLARVLGGSPLICRAIDELLRVDGFVADRISTYVIPAATEFMETNIPDDDDGEDEEDHQYHKSDNTNCVIIQKSTRTSRYFSQVSLTPSTCHSSDTELDHPIKDQENDERLQEMTPGSRHNFLMQAANLLDGDARDMVQLQADHQFLTRIPNYNDRGTKYLKKQLTIERKELETRLKNIMDIEAKLDAKFPLQALDDDDDDDDETYQAKEGSSSDSSLGVMDLS